METRGADAPLQPASTVEATAGSEVAEEMSAFNPPGAPPPSLSTTEKGHNKLRTIESHVEDKYSPYLREYTVLIE
jgi:hypothetical protein